jgi:release factor glutamine methyltransferase
MEFRDNLLAHMIDRYVVDLEKYYDKEEARALIYWLAEDFFGATRTKLVLKPNWRLSESEMLKLHFAYKELKNYKPVQYILGHVPFMDLSLSVSPDVLIPRPETEQLVDWIFHQESSGGQFVLDAGTGSGCIALSLKKQWPDALVYGYDNSIKALEIAKTNARLNNLEVTFFEANMCIEVLPDGILFDIIVSNPPYVLDSEHQVMRPNVLDYEPHRALFVGDDDPLRFYKAILIQSRQSLKPNGRVYFEINEQMGDQMTVLLKEMNYSEICVKRDLNDKVRFISGVKNP